MLGPVGGPILGGCHQPGWRYLSWSTCRLGCPCSSWRRSRRSPKREIAARQRRKTSTTCLLVVAAGLADFPFASPAPPVERWADRSYITHHRSGVDRGIHAIPVVPHRIIQAHRHAFASQTRAVAQANMTMICAPPSLRLPELPSKQHQSLTIGVHIILAKKAHETNQDSA